MAVDDEPAVFSYKTLFYKMRQYGIVLPKLRSQSAAEAAKVAKAGSG